MGRNGTQVSPKATEKEKISPEKAPDDFMSVQMHRRAADGMETIAKVLGRRAQDNLKMPSVRFELGKAHLWDLAVKHLAKELGVEL